MQWYREQKYGPPKKCLIRIRPDSKLNEFNVLSNKTNYQLTIPVLNFACLSNMSLLGSHV